MNLNTRGWDNAYVPEKVFVEPIRGTPIGTIYDYSYDKPAQLEYTIESLLGGYYGSQNFMTLFYCLPEVFAPVHEIASRISDAVWQLKNYTNDEVIYTDNNFNRLFSQPNPLQTMRAYVYQAVCYEIITGKQFFFKNKPDTLPNELGSVVALWNLPAQDTTADMKKGYDPYSATEISDFVNNYWIPKDQDTTQKRIFPVDNVLPVINYSLTKPTEINCAKSMLLGAHKAIANLIPVYEARQTIYIKRGALGFLVSQLSDESGKQAMSPKQKQDLRRDVDATYGLTGGRSTVGITDIPVKFERTAMSISELAPFDETLADAVAIYKVLRVPRHLVPSKDSSTFANADSDLKSFYSDVIVPWAKRYADLWTTWLGVDTRINYKRYIYADFSHLDILQENKKDKAATEQITGNVFLQRFTNGICTLNDWISANGDKRVLGIAIYDKKMFEMTPEEVDTVKNIINLKSAAVTAQQATPATPKV